MHAPKHVRDDELTTYVFARGIFVSENISVAGSSFNVHDRRDDTDRRS